MKSRTQNKIPFANIKNMGSLKKLEDQNLKSIIGGGPTQFTIECLVQTAACLPTQDQVCGGNHLCTCQE